MNCKNCGAELLLQDRKCICQSCGSVFNPERVYEAIDVYICYMENDASGRRTKDSIIAQEVYRKLEENKIATFYERISADGLIGEDLEMLRYGAVCDAKAILVVGASVENFTALEEKYGQWFAGKRVIPFCVDVNPGQIPKTLSKIQAVNYATIGWETDLVNGLYNLLGREKEVNTGALYGKRQGKKFLIIGIVAAALLILGAVALILLLGGPEDSPVTPDTPAQTTAATEPETAHVPTQQEIYDQAAALLEQGKLTQALTLFLQIPEHPDSANQIQKLYAKYEGYYQNGNVQLHLEIMDNIRADVEITVRREDTLIKIVESAELRQDTVTFEYTDNHQQSGTVQLLLTDTDLQLTCDDEKTHFALAEKSDQPLVQVTGEELRTWAAENYTYAQIVAAGYELEDVENMCGFEFPSDDNKLYKIKDTEIYLSMVKFYFDGYDEIWYGDERVVAGIAAPARLIAPSMIDKPCLPVCEDDAIYWPNGYLYHYFSPSFTRDYFESESDTVTGSTMIGFAIHNPTIESDWDYLVESTFAERVRVAAAAAYPQTDPDGYVEADIYGHNSTHYLVKVYASSLIQVQKNAWYKISKTDYSVTFLQEGPNIYGVDNPAGAYPLLAAEFPSAFGGGEMTYTEVPYLFKVPAEGHMIFQGPGYHYDTVQTIEIGTFTIVEEQYDSGGNLWGKLKSGVGWICLTEISAE